MSSKTENEKEYKWVSFRITPEEVKKQLDERPGGRKAGRGDSPWTQERYEQEYGIDKLKKRKDGGE